MREIQLHDLPNEHGEPVVHTFSMPAGWDEVTVEHLPALAMARIAAPTDGGVRFELLCSLAAIPPSLAKRLPGAADLTFRPTYPEGTKPPKDAPTWVLLQELDWVWTPPKWVKSLMPTLHHAGIHWTGPSDDLDNLSIDQWAWLNVLLSEFNAPVPEGADIKEAAAQKHDLLMKWMGTAYRPVDTVWSNLDIERNAHGLSTMDLPTCMAAKLNYEALYASVPERYPRVYDPSGEVSRSPAGPFALVIEVAKSGVYGTKNQASQERMHEVMLYMEHVLYQQYRDAAAAREKGKTNF